MFKKAWAKDVMNYYRFENSIKAACIQSSDYKFSLKDNQTKVRNILSDQQKCSREIVKPGSKYSALYHGNQNIRIYGTLHVTDLKTHNSIAQYLIKLTL